MQWSGSETMGNSEVILRSLLVLFWGETARVGRPTAKSSHCVCVKRSLNLKAWLHFAPHRQQSSREARENFFS